MIGIYKITNLITGGCYIGKSKDINRRWIEHRTPKAGGNDLLHNDMKKYGIDNFVFEVLEECEQSKLLERELYFIKTMQPYYNRVGKTVTKEVREKISNSAKKWWNKLPEATKQKIITNNLTGPKKGHSVSAETRAKISKKVSEVQKQKVKCVETGQIFTSVREFEIFVGASNGTCAAYWRGKIKSVKGYHVEKV